MLVIQCLPSVVDSGGSFFLFDIPASSIVFLPEWEEHDEVLLYFIVYNLISPDAVFDFYIS